MQELRSTEILDKEIQADARRKVENILKKAEADCQSLYAGVDAKVEAAKKEKQDFYEKKLNAYASDLNASVPLEKERFEVSFIQNSIINSINEYLADMDASQIFNLITKDFDFKNKITGKTNAYVYGFTAEEAKKQLSSKIGSLLGACSKTEFGKIVAEEDIGLKKNYGIILESEDKALRCRLTLVEVFNRILDKNRADLYSALFGNGGNK